MCSMHNMPPPNYLYQTKRHITIQDETKRGAFTSLISPLRRKHNVFFYGKTTHIK